MIIIVGLRCGFEGRVSTSLTEFQKKCSYHSGSGGVVRFCANLKKGTIKSRCPTLKIRCPAHLKISFSSKEGKKFISTNFAKNGVIEPFLDADTTSGFKQWKFNMNSRKKAIFAKIAHLQYCQLIVKLQIGGASDFQGGAPTFYGSILQVCTRSDYPTTSRVI